MLQAPVSEPVREAGGTETSVVARRQRSVVHCDAVIKRLGIGDDRPRVPGRVQELPHEVVLTDRFGAGQFERAVQRLGESRVGHDGGDIIRRDGCIRTGGSRTVCPSVAAWAMPPTNSKNCVARTIV